MRKMSEKAMKAANGGGRYTCSVCDRTYYSPWAFLKHIRKCWR